MALDPKMKDTIQWSAIYNGGASVLEYLISYAAYAYIFRLAGYGLNVSEIVSSAINGIIMGAIVGFVLAKWYPQIMELSKKYLKNSLNTLFKLLFYPYAVGAILSVVLSLGAAFAVGTGPLVSVMGTLVVRYLYAKMLSAKVGQYYPATPTA